MSDVEKCEKIAKAIGKTLTELKALPEEGMTVLTIIVCSGMKQLGFSKKFAIKTILQTLDEIYEEDDE